MTTAMNLQVQCWSQINSSVLKSSSPSDNSQQQDTHPTANTQSTSAPITPTNTVTAKENNTNIKVEIQSEDAQIDENEFYNIFNTLVHEEAELSTRYVDSSNMHTFYHLNTDGLKITVRISSWKSIQASANKTTTILKCVCSYSPRSLRSCSDFCRLRCTQIFSNLLDASEMDFLNGPVKEEQAPRAWYEELSNFLMSKGFTKGLQIYQSPRARPTKKHLKEVKRIFRYLKGTINMGLWYSKDSGFELTAFSDADHAGCLNTRKSTYRGIQFLGDKLVSWMSKKQDCTATSSAKAEYVALTTSCAQVM
ncbi:hypothetical protein Tco_1322464 [Tanacetum coccineum]